MKNEIIHFAIEELKPRARRLFEKSCGFRPDSDKHRRMACAAEDVLRKIEPGLRPAAVVSAYEAAVLRGDTAVFDNIPFRCEAFARVDPARLHALYAFILTAGPVQSEPGDVMTQLYADLWGTAFADAASDALALQLAARAAAVNAQAATFGPGFYGMALSEIPKIFDLLNGDEIGVAVHRQSCYMTPEKSLAGFIAVAEDLSALPPADCVNCVGNRGGCAFCRNNPGVTSK